MSVKAAHDDWYKDAIVYQTHVKAFADSNGDGTGDFRGLTERLDYIRDLGVTAVWLLPFYPSPQRDDGYDIAGYEDVHPDYGTMDDAKAFIAAAHERGLRVITELIINHTSDQHPWFQAARNAPKGSAERDFYVWSDDDKPYSDSRIIFTDTEISNWAWDPVAGQYYWHRFFSHQPDLNFDNPEVMKAVLKIMYFWLDLGVDGLRLDAIPYLIEREGTSCENLPETHEKLREIRAALDERYPDRMLLAEANQWPEDVREYFADGDECHMAYHFPVMPRMYMAVAQEDRHPIIDIMAQTPDIPENCQWAIFLRNHDELTLEMVTETERDYMYRQYAADPRMRINVGIRRRLAPLLDNDRGKIKLMNSLLFSLLGTPVMYYGDEIGMGDNVYLGDRNGVRTPMQWSPDRNGGFSRADPQRLYLPPVMDATYGFEAVNVEAQSRTPASLLNWTRRMIAVRKQHIAFGRGTLRFLAPGNRRILAYVREHTAEDGSLDVVLCVANLSRTPQPVELDLSEFEGAVPVELSGRAAFPPVGKLPYLLTLQGHGFYWFDLASDAREPIWHSDALASTDLPAFVIGPGWESFTDQSGERGRTLAVQLPRTLMEYLPRQRWFAAKGARIDAVRIERTVHFAPDGTTEDDSEDASGWLLLWLDVRFQGDGDADAPAPQRYLMPLSLAWDARAEQVANSIGSATLARTRHHSRVGIVFDAFQDAGFCRAVVAAMAGNATLPLGDGVLQAWSTDALDGLIGPGVSPAELSVEPAAVQGSNTAIVLSHERHGQLHRVFLKGYRRLRDGINPELEIGRHLTEASRFERIAPLAGALEWQSGDAATDRTAPRTALASLQGYTPNQGDAWSWTLDYLEREVADERMAALARPNAGPSLSTIDDGQRHDAFVTMMRVLGQRTGEMHVGLLHDSDEAFTPVALAADAPAALARAVKTRLDAVLAQLEAGLPGLEPDERDTATQLIDARTALNERLQGLAAIDVATGIATRVHGDYHLGQVLIDSNDFIIIDFEGEPGRSLTERRAKSSPLKDLAGMLRSIDYAASTARLRAFEFDAVTGDDMAASIERWRSRCSDAFIEGWQEATRQGGQPQLWPGDAGDAMLSLYLFDKALYELAYEIDNRPAWVGVPLSGLLRLLN